MLETEDHLLTKCNFAEAIWQTVAPEPNLPHYNSLLHLGNLWIGWFSFLLQAVQLLNGKARIFVLYPVEIVERKESKNFLEKKSIPQLAALVREEISWYNRAMSLEATWFGKGVHAERILHCCEGFSVPDLMVPDGAVLLLTVALSLPLLPVRQGVFMLLLKGASSCSVGCCVGA
jgi:hypothetical protein